MREVGMMLFGVALAISAIMLGSTLATRAWEAEPESGPVRSVSVEEYRRGQIALPCPECADWSGQFLNGRLVIQHKGRDVTREVVGTREQMFRRTGR